MCEFGSKLHRTAAQWLSSTAIVCPTPAHAPGDVTVRVTSNGQQFTNGANFMFHASAAVTSTRPSRGSLSGGTQVAVFGSGFVNSTLARCRFGQSVIPARFLSESQLVCDSPARPATGTVNVAVSNNGVDFASSDVTFVYTVTTSVVGLFPRIGPVSGNTRVRVTGNFQNAALASCRFGVVDVHAVSVEDTSLVCVSPAHAAGAVPVMVSSNGVDWVRFGDFTYQPDAVVTSIHPVNGPEVGGTVVVISGQNFVQSASLFCLFGLGAQIPATWIHSTAIRCSTPPHTAGAVRVEVTNNGVDFTGSGVVYTFTGTESVARISPAAGPVAGNTEVVVHGTGFVQSTLLRCKFDRAVVVPSVYVSSMQIKCPAPARGGEGDRRGQQ
jgi:hypothetical protein